MKGLKVSERIQLINARDVWNLSKRIGSTACAIALGWSMYHANGINVLPDTLATVVIGVLLAQLFRS